MKILIALNHPAHYYLFKFISKELQKKGHEVRFVIKDKDILENLLISEEINYTKLVTRRKRKNNAFSILSGLGAEMIKQDYSLIRFLRLFRPDIMLGTDISISHVGLFKKIPSIIFNEDDIEINKLFCFVTYPFASQILTPDICNAGLFNKKQTKYKGYQKLAYLHPNWFAPDIGVVRKYITDDKPYFLIRLVSFTAGHDIEHKHGGITIEILRKLISILSHEGSVFITSEDKILDEFKNYQLIISPNDIHHIMAFSKLIIGDSQSMIVEAAMLGIPSIRFNSFVGKISVLNELENKYRLSNGVYFDNPESLLETIKHFLSISGLKEVYDARRLKMLSEKIDVTAFMVWFIENYPDSVKIMKENPEYQDRFK